MNAEFDNRVRKVVEELERELPSEPGRVELASHPDEVQLLGDKVGYLRLGLGILKGAVSPPVAACGLDDALDTGSAKVITHDPHEVFLLRKVIEWPEGRRSGWVHSGLLKAGCLIAASITFVMLMFLLIAGIRSVFGWTGAG